MQTAARTVANVVEDLSEGGGFVDYKKFIGSLRRSTPRLYLAIRVEVSAASE